MSKEEFAMLLDNGQVEQMKELINPKAFKVD